MESPYSQLKRMKNPNLSFLPPIFLSLVWRWWLTAMEVRCKGKPLILLYWYFIHLKQWCLNIFLSIYTWHTVKFPADLTKRMLRIFFNPPFPSQVTIDGEDVENMNQLVRQVAYLNTRCHHYNFKNTIMFFMVNICQHNSNNNVDNNNNDNNFQSGRFLN